MNSHKVNRWDIQNGCCVNGTSLIVRDSVKVGILPENGATSWPAAPKSLEIMSALTQP